MDHFKIMSDSLERIAKRYDRAHPACGVECEAAMAPITMPAVRYAEKEMDRAVAERVDGRVLATAIRRYNEMLELAGAFVKCEQCLTAQS